MAVSFGLLIILFAVSVFLVIQSNKLSDMTLRLENTMKASLQEATHDMRTLENDLSKLMITSNEKSATQLLSKIALKSSACGQALSELPIVATGVQNTLKFTNQLSSYCVCALNDYSVDGGLPENFDNQISDFFDTCKNVNVELQKVENDVATQKLSLLTVNNGQTETEGLFGSIDNNLLEYPSVIFDGPFSDGQERTTPKQERKEVSKEDAMKVVENLGFSLEYKGEVNGVVPVYLFENEKTSVQITKKGGLPLMVMADRNIENVSLSEKEAEEKALEFANKLQFGEIKNVWQEYYSNFAVFNFTPVIDGVVIYPDIFKVKVALDNGEVLALESKSYIMNNHEREIPEPKISETEAKKRLKDGFLIETSRLTIISVNEKEHLCYEFFGKYNDLDFAVYVSALDGEEKTSFRILSTETGRIAN